jgi:hypothetical protein
MGDDLHDLNRQLDEMIKELRETNDKLAARLTYLLGNEEPATVAAEAVWWSAFLADHPELG